MQKVYEKEYEKEAKEIVKKMTLDEKIHMCTGESYWATWPLERFGIPSCVMADGPHGVRKVKERDHLGQAVNERATALPVSAAMGASWDKELLYEAGGLLGRECQSLGIDIILGPAVNMKRTVLGGRNFEYLSEDPVLAGKLGAQLVKGIQDTGTGACIKHFACNNSEKNRMTVDAVVDERTLRELYLKVFEIIIRDAAPLAVMGAYNKVNGTYACENEKLLTKILREEWGFGGIVISDWLAVEDSVKAMDAGLNLEMPGNPLVYKKLKKAISEGSLEETKLNQRVTELLRVLIKLSKQRNPAPIPWDRHKALAQRSALEGMVLLKNENRLLPFDGEIKSIAIIGTFAAHPRVQGGGSSKVNTQEEENILTALRKNSGGSIDICYAAGYDAQGNTNEVLLKEACHTALACDKAVVFAGLLESCESEGYDRENMYLPKGHLELIHKLAEVRRDILVVLENGSAVEIPFADDVDGILEAWLLGQETADVLAKVILNKEQPSGRLSETFPIRLSDEPAGYNASVDEGKLLYGERMLTGYRYYDKKNIRTAFPFGHGLSYTEFIWSEMELSCEEMSEKDSLEISLTVRNAGELPGYEVVQIYVSCCDGRLLHPVKELKDFAKLYLEPGEEKEVKIVLEQDAFTSYSEVLGGWVTEAGRYEILAGASSADIHWQKSIRIKNTEPQVKNLTKQSALEEWLWHPVGKRLAEDMLKGYKGFGLGGGKTFLELNCFVRRIMLEMPMTRLVTASNGSFTDSELSYMLDALEETREEGK